jgi:Glutamine amidotransferase domain
LQVVALLFKKLGPTFMSKLKGTFAFAVYDSASGRALAAADRAASHPLWQAHLAADNTLVIACGVPAFGAPDAPAMTARTAIAAGEYKFGHRSAPLAYAAPEAATASRCAEARSVAMAALLVRHPAA